MRQAMRGPHNLLSDASWASPTTSAGWSTVSGQDDGTTFWNVVCFGIQAATSLATGAR
jgi:hypothetical protein